MKRADHAYALPLLAFFMIISDASLVEASSFSFSSNFILTNATIDVGQITVANVVVSGGSGMYAGQWTWIGQNQVNNEVLKTIPDGKNPYEIAFTPSGSNAYVVNWGSGSANVIDVATNSTFKTISIGSGPYGVAVNPQGTRAYITVGGAGTVAVVDTSSYAVVNTITVGSFPISVAFTPSGGLAFVANYNSGAVSVVDTPSNSVSNSVSVGIGPYYLAVNPQGTTVYVTNYVSGTVSMIDIASNSVTKTLTVGANPDGVAFNPSGSIAYVTNHGSGTVNVIDVASGSIVNTISVGQAPKGVAFNPSGSLAYVANYNSNTVDVIDVATNTVVNTISVGANPNWLSIDPKGNIAYVTNYAGNSISVVGSLPETSVQNLPITQSNGLLQLEVNAVNSNTLIFTFNGVKYTETTGTSASLYGSWNLYAFGEDNGTNLYAYGSNVLSAHNSITINPELSLPSITSLGGNVIDVGQSATLQSSWSGGTPKYTAKYYTGTSTCGYESYLTGHSGLASTSDTYSVSPTSSTYYCSRVLDSASTPVETRGTTPELVTVNPALAAPTISSSNVPSVNTGQYEIFSSYETGGTSPYTYNFLVYNSATNVLVANQLTTSNTFAYLVPSSEAGNVLYANVFVTDSASSPVTVNSVLSDTITVTTPSPLAVPSISPSYASTEDVGTTVRFATYETGGTLPYTYNFIVYNSITNDAVGNLLTTSNTFSYAITSSQSGATLFANVLVTDSSTIPLTQNSVHSGTITINPSLSVSLSTYSASLNAGDYQTITATLGGGTSPYTYNWVVTSGGAVSFNSLASLSSMSNSISFTSTLGAGTYYVNLSVTDSSTTPVTALPPSNAAVAFTSAAAGGGTTIKGSGGTGATQTTSAPTSIPTTTIATSTTTIPATATTSIQTTASTTLTTTILPPITALQSQEVVVNVSVSANSPSYVNFTASNATLEIPGGEYRNGSVSVRIRDVVSILAPPSGTRLISAINVSTDQPTVPIGMRMSYPCGMDVAPYEYSQPVAQWTKISNYSIDSRLCSVLFSMPKSDFTVALVSPESNPYWYVPYAIGALALILVVSAARMVLARHKSVPEKNAKKAGPS